MLQKPLQKIEFKVESPVAKQHFTLLSVVQDAEFYVSTSTNPQIINQNTVWNSNKAKIIYGDLKVADGKSLTLSEGTKVYFHRDANLKIGKNAQLIANGNLGKSNSFEEIEMTQDMILYPKTGANSTRTRRNCST
jgi:hypothetical protein